VQLIGSEVGGQPNAEQRRQQLSHLLTGKLPAGEEGFAVGRVLDHKGGGTAKLSGYREALQQARCENSDRCNESNRGIGRHEGQYRRADDHQSNGERERGFAAGAVGIGAKNDRSDRPGQIRQTK
jgi:hypothetical protein